MKRTLAAFALLMAGVLAGGWAAAQVNGSGGVYINGVLQGVGSGSGTVTSVGLTLPSFMNVSGTNPITTSGTFVFGLANVSAGAVFTGPASGADAAPTFKTLLAPNFGISDSSGVLTSNGSGTWSITTPAGTGANKALSNLTGVAINDHLTPAIPLTVSLGGGNLPFLAAHTGTGGLSTWNAAADLYPLWQYTGTGIIAGAGSTTAPDVGLARPSAGLFKFTDGSTGSGSIAATSLTRVAASSDVAPSSTLVKSGDAFPGAATNTTGANTILAGGIGKRIFTVVDYTQLAGTTVTITVNGVAIVKTENVDWYDSTSNGAVAISLASAIDGIAGVSASAATNDVRIVPDVGTYSLTIAKTAADAGMTATSGVDGTVSIAGPVIGGSNRGISGVLAIGDESVERGRLYLKHVNSESGSAPYQYGFLIADYESGTNTSPLASFAGRHIVATEQAVLGPAAPIRWYAGIESNLNYHDPRTGIEEIGSGGGVKITKGLTGYGNLEASTLYAISNVSAPLLSMNDGSGHTSSFAAATQSGNIAYTLPAVANVSGALRNDGTGSLTWGHELLTDQFTYTFFDLNTDLPATLDVPSIYVNRARAIHLTEIFCEIDAGSATVNLTKNGANIATADITCAVTPSGTDGTTGILDNSGSHFVSTKDAIAVGDKIGHVMVTVGASLKRLNVVVRYSVD